VVAVFPRSFLALLIVAGPVGMGVLFGACSSLQGAPAGTQCFSAIDCAAGLVCIKKGSTSVCSSNLTSIETMIDSGMDAASGDAGPIMLADGALQPGTDAGSPGADTAMPPVDAAQPVDTGQPPVDTGAPHDTGVDTGHDAGMPPVDATGAS
jgi:hypothetical protein